MYNSCMLYVCFVGFSVLGCCMWCIVDCVLVLYFVCSVCVICGVWLVYYVSVLCVCVICGF